MRETGPGGVQDTIAQYMRQRHWTVHIMTCGKYQKGIPDMYCMHPMHGDRWVEIKRPDRRVTFTNDQKRVFPTFTKNKKGIWVLRSVDEYPLLFGPPNLDQYRPFGNPPKSRRQYRAK